MPPMMSLSQWTPETSLPATISTVSTAMSVSAALRTARSLTRPLSWSMAVGITHRVSTVVDEG